jgi:hypothetical protein
MVSALRLSMVALAAAVATPAFVTSQVVDLPSRDTPLQPVLTPVFRVGKPDGPRWELYGNRVEVAFDAAGNLHVFDAQNFRVVVIGKEGALLREVGKRGEGPGELQNPVGFAVLRDGTIAVADMGQRAFVLYDAAGSFQRSARFGSESFAAVGKLRGDPRGGSLISIGQTMAMSQTAGGGVQVVRGPAAASVGNGRSIVRHPLTAGIQSRVVHIGWEPPRSEAPAPAASAGTAPSPTGVFGRAFEPQLHAAVLPDGQIVVSDSSAYAIEVIGPDGGVRRTFRRPLRPQPVTAAMQRAERQRRLAELSKSGARLMLDRSGGAGPSEEQIQQRVRQNLEQMPFYPELPVVAGLAAGWTGKIWVERTPPGGSGDGAVDVIEATGAYIGTISPDGPRIPDAFGPDGLVAYIERDPFGVVSVAVRRLATELR